MNMGRPEHHSADHLKERGVDTKNGQRSILQGRDQSVFNQTNINTILRATLGRLLRDKVKRLAAFFEQYSSVLMKYQKLFSDAFNTGLYGYLQITGSVDSQPLSK